MPEMHLISLLCLCYPEIWRFIYYQRTRPSPSPTPSNSISSSQHKGVVFQHFGVINDVRYRRSFRYRIGSQRFVPVPCEADALPCTITGQSTVVPFRVCPNCVLGSRFRTGFRRLAREFFFTIDPTLRYLVLFFC